jgi:ferric-dicitrate binding protein FerR (iron transport regulator)
MACVFIDWEITGNYGKISRSPVSKECNMADESRLAELLVKMVCQTLTDKEREELDSWGAASAGNETFIKEVTSDESIMGDLKTFMGMSKSDVRSKYDAGIRGHVTLSEQETLSRPDPLPISDSRPTVRRLKTYLVAASVIGCLILLYLLKDIGKKSYTDLAQRSYSDSSFFRKAPDSGSVRLALGDGSVLNLDSMQEGQVARQGNMQASIADDGRLLRYTPGQYAPRETAGPVNTVYNTLTVPYGNRYKLQLSDGTKVTLNVGSSIKFPVAFTGDKRVVEVTGEAFFEVASDRQHPFIVHGNRQDVEVLGTSFSVTDYPNEAHSKVVVATGRVRVHSRKDTTAILDPLQQADIGAGGDVRVASGVDVKDELSWKEEYFNFDGLDIKVALWQLAQSYHMRILFEENIKSGTLGYGNIQRDLPLSRLLKDLELPDLHFEIRMQDNTIVVRR